MFLDQFDDTKVSFIFSELLSQKVCIRVEGVRENWDYVNYFLKAFLFLQGIILLTFVVKHPEYGVMNQINVICFHAFKELLRQIDGSVAFSQIKGPFNDRNNFLIGPYNGWVISEFNCIDESFRANVLIKQVNIPEELEIRTWVLQRIKYSKCISVIAQ